MDKKTLILIFSLLAAGFFLFTFIGVIFVLKELWFEPLPVDKEIPEIYKTECLQVKDEKGHLREICPYEALKD